MNEQFEQLALQAGFNLHNDIIDGHNFNHEIEKFAQLIVRECGVALSPMLRDMVSRGQAFDLIKRHFGVEE